MWRFIAGLSAVRNRVSREENQNCAARVLSLFRLGWGGVGWGRLTPPLTIIFLEGADEKFTGTNNFFSSYKHINNILSGNGFANNFFLRNTMLY